jgi:hypothetical protein
MKDGCIGPDPGQGKCVWHVIDSALNRRAVFLLKNKQNEAPARKARLTSIIDRIEVDDGAIR